MNARTSPIAATARPARMNAAEIQREIEARAKAIRARQSLGNFTPFPDPEGEDRDERRVTTWDFTR